MIGILASSALTIALYPVLSLIQKREMPLVFERGSIAKVSDNVYVGPYPNDDEFKIMANTQVTTIVSLLNSDLNPAEAQLVERERRLAEKYRLEFLNYPMVPWVIGNEQALRNMEGIFKDQRRIVYIHCYLGLHRVAQVVRTFNLGFENRPVKALPENFERGPLYKFSEALAFGPYPTDDEFQTLSDAKVATIISLLTAQSPSEQPWMDRERKILEAFGLRYANFPMNPERIVDTTGNQVVNYINNVEHPNKIYVHGFLSPDKEQRASSVIELYIQYWKTQQLKQ